MSFTPFIKINPDPPEPGTLIRVNVVDGENLRGHHITHYNERLRKELHHELDRFLDKRTPGLFSVKKTSD